jgi:energy-coupling factor transport system permease protein
MSDTIGARRIGYRRRATPLHAARAPIAAAYAAAIACAALLTEHPFLLSSLLVTVIAAGAAADVGRELLRATRVVALPMVAFTVIVNLLVSRNGLTVFARLGDWGVLGQENLTVEAAVYGAVFGLRLLVVTLAFLLMTCAVNPDDLLRAARRISRRSALTATLTTRLLPVLLQDARRLSEAQRCRPEGAPKGARRTVAVLRATVVGALDRSLDVAAVLEMRGYGRTRRAPALRAQWSRHDIAFALAAGSILCLAVFAAVSGQASFQAYPLVNIGLSPTILILSGLLTAVALLPFCSQRGVEP